MESSVIVLDENKTISTSPPRKEKLKKNSMHFLHLYSNLIILENNPLLVSLGVLNYVQ